MRFIMRKISTLVTVAALAIGTANCSGTDGSARPQLGPNPFLDHTGGKADTGYINESGVEIEATLEADIQADDDQIFEAAPNLLQFATTYLRKRRDIYIMILNEDTTAVERVEWRVGGSWISAEEARTMRASQLTHFRMQGVNIVLLNDEANQVTEGQTITARVPLRPYTIMQDAGDACAEPAGHISLSPSTYWYLWDPEWASACPVDSLTQEMTITVSKVQPKNPSSWPEYDRLLEDKDLSVVVVFGKLDEGEVHEDYNWYAADEFVGWLKGAGFEERENPSLGKRMVRTVGELTETVDVFYPDLFESVVDYQHLDNWRRAVAEHEVVVYNGHSVLGTGSAYDEVSYPPFYQIHFIGGCLGYEYYVRPVLAGKGGWENVDAVASIVENSYDELPEATGVLLSKLFYGFEHGGVTSWQEIMGAINYRLGHYHFGVSGARTNCFTPEGNRCGG
jgi:hypothetical protein